MLWDAVEENLVIMASKGLSDEYVLQQRIPKERVYAAAAPNGKFRPLVTPDLRLDPFGQPDLIESERLCSVLSTPLLISGELIGVLNIYSKDRPRVFSSDEIELAEIFANQAAIAIQNARLRGRELEGLRVTSGAIHALGRSGRESGYHG
jgi:GAF domain-containing protein